MRASLRALGVMTVAGSLLTAGCGAGNHVGIGISPTTATMSTRATKTFESSITHSNNFSVTWAVQEGSAGGSISSTGVYTAPSVAGTYHIVVTSVADPVRTATAVVTVQSGASSATVN